MEGQTSKKYWEPIDFTVYYRFVRWYVLAAFIIEAVFRVGIGRFSGTFFYDQQDLLAWIPRLILFFYLGTRSLKKFGQSTPIAAMSGAIAGAILGILVSLVRFFDGFEIWKIFNIINELVVCTIMGALVGILVVYLSNLKHHNN